MQNDIYNLVMNNIFGTNTECKAVYNEGDEKKGFFTGAFYITGMTYEEYRQYKHKYSRLIKGSFDYFD